ncbi:hypothetical protein GE09DRAFT_1267703 [Coniochaeta sp. 2T2.1]|nr:hypothetical protein GE09DRAFT_1267703 [Coniochaeta sp. 2T2.1]
MALIDRATRQTLPRKTSMVGSPPSCEGRQTHLPGAPFTPGVVRIRRAAKVASCHPGESVSSFSWRKADSPWWLATAWSRLGRVRHQVSLLHLTACYLQLPVLGQRLRDYERYPWGLVGFTAWASNGESRHLHLRNTGGGREIGYINMSRTLSSLFTALLSSLLSSLHCSPLFTALLSSLLSSLHCSLSSPLLTALLSSPLSLFAALLSSPCTLPWSRW